MDKIRRQHSDYWLSLGIFTLIAFGLIMIYSVSKYYSLQITNEATDKYFLTKQLISFGIGFIAWLVMQSIDYRFWQKNASSMLIITLSLLILPLLWGGGTGHRWINLGFTTVQPAEIAKITFLIYLSGWFASKKDSIKEIQAMFWPFVAMVGFISLLLLVQKDLGTLSIYIFLSTAVFVVAGASAFQLVAGGGLGVFLLWLAIKIEPYRLQRIMTFLDPSKENLGAGYHIRNALIAIGSGGLWGLGFGQSRQKYLYLPEAHTDSIFAIICEELGFLRSSLIIVAFVFIALRGYRIAANAPDTFSRLLAVGITTWIVCQALINIAAMLSIVPLTGVPLPFISYGGSSLVILLGAVGILVNISKQQRS